MRSNKGTEWEYHVAEGGIQLRRKRGFMTSRIEQSRLWGIVDATGASKAPARQVGIVGQCCE